VLRITYVNATHGTFMNPNVHIHSHKERFGTQTDNMHTSIRVSCRSQGFNQPQKDLEQVVRPKISENNQAEQDAAKDAQVSHLFL
jgi:hypothetical protein